MEEFKFVALQDPNEEVLNRKISEVEPIGEGRNAEIRSREDLAGLVEFPLLSACQELFDKNIRTHSTSANAQDIQNGFAYINIDHDALSEENKKVAEVVGTVSFSEADEMTILDVKIPITSESTVSEIQAAAEEIAHKFEKQAYAVTTYSLQEMRKFYGIDESDETFPPESFSDQFYWSPEHKLFFLSEEQFKKATENH